MTQELLGQTIDLSAARQFYLVFPRANGKNGTVNRRRIPHNPRRQPAPAVRIVTPALQKQAGALRQERVETAAAALRTSEKQFRSMFEKHSAIMLLLEPSTGRILHANLAAVAFYGYSRKKFQSMSIDQITRLPSTQIAEARQQALCEQCNYFVFPHRLANGAVRTVEVHSSPIERNGQRLLFSIIHDITERKQVEKALRASLQEKEALLKEIHHRVKSNLQIVSSMMRLQSGRPQHPEAQRVLLAMQNRVQAMALIHEHLYQTENLATVDLGDYLKRLCAHLVHAFGTPPQTVEFHQNIAPMRVEVDQAIPGGLLVNELVSNCLKHAFPAGRTGAVSVALQPVAHGPAWRLRVADNGVGLPAGLDMNALTSVGLRLAPGLARQMGGKLEIGPGPGTVFEVVFTPGVLVVKPDQRSVKTSNKSPRVNPRVRKRAVP